MSESPNKLIRFWQELKRRKTGKVIIAYAATAFILLQLADILTPALLLPEWTTRFVTLILIIGFPLAVIFSWVFEITPEGIKKTESFEESEKKVTPTKQVKRKLKPSYVINAILIMAVIVLAYPKIFKRNTLDKMRSSGERISVAVMPFQNMTNDTAWNIRQVWIQDILINSLSNSEELRIRQAENINNLIKNQGIVNYASISPPVASTIAQKLDANVFIYGNIKKAGNTLRLNAQLIDSKSEDVFKSFQIEGDNKEEKIFQLIDSLSIEIKNFLILSKLKQYHSLEAQTFITTNSPEAFRYFINGKNSFYKQDYPTARSMFSRALSIDSNIYIAFTFISTSYFNEGLYDQAKKWCLKAYNEREQMPMILNLLTNWLYAINFKTPHEGIVYLKDILEIDDQSPTTYFLLGNAYCDLYQYEKAIPEYKKSLEIFKKWEVKPYWIYWLAYLGDAYHKTGKYTEEKNLYDKAEHDFPDNPVLIYKQAVLALSEGKIEDADYFIEKYLYIRKVNSVPEASIINSVAGIYSDAGNLEKAEVYYRQALSLEPENSVRMNNLAWFLIEKDRSINEGMELIDKALKLSPDEYYMIDTKGWGLYKQGKYEDALKFFEKADSLKPVYDHELYLHLEAAKKAVAGLN